MSLAAFARATAPKLDLFPADADDLPMVNQFTDIIFTGRLVWLLEQRNFAQFNRELPTASQPQIMAAASQASVTGNIPVLAALVARMEPTSRIPLNKVIHRYSAEAVNFLYGCPAHIVPPTAEEIAEHLRAATLDPITLAVVLRHCRPLLYLVEAPKPVAGLPGWGMATMFIQRNEMYARYAAVIANERQRIREQLWRAAFWAAVLRIRMVQFQARYWAPGGAGYEAARASFEAARAAYLKKTN